MSSRLRTKIRKILEENYDYYPDFFDPLSNPAIHGFKGFTDRLGKQQLGEEVIEEKAATFMDVPPSVGLVKYKTTLGVSLHLFDFKTRKCFGHISLQELSKRSYMVTTIAAEKGFGPLMLEIGMMGVYPAGICIDRVGPSKAPVWNMFNVFINERPEIKTVHIKEGDEEYDNRHAEDEGRHFLYNTICFRPPSSWYNKMLERGARLSQDNGTQQKEIVDICRGYFTDKYRN